MHCCVCCSGNVPTHCVSKYKNWGPGSVQSFAAVPRRLRKQQTRRGQITTAALHPHLGSYLVLAAADGAPAWTLDQIAGLLVGGTLVAFLVLATRADVVIAKAQRAQLGLCTECGGLNDSATCQEKNCPFRKE